MKNTDWLFKKHTPVAVLLDFDGTLTDIDVVDGLLVQFAPNRDWIRYEKEWLENRISSGACMRKQLSSIRISRRDLNEYLKSVELDPGFRTLLGVLKSQQIPHTILSDGFDYFIRRILAFNGVKGIQYRANQLSWRNSRLWPSFPYKNTNCRRCAHCKRQVLLKHRSRVKHFIFVGDGRSDICALKGADTVFAKNKLAEYCVKHGKPFIAYDSLLDVADALPKVLRNIQLFQKEEVSEKVGLKT